MNVEERQKGETKGRRVRGKNQRALGERGGRGQGNTSKNFIPDWI